MTANTLLLIEHLRLEVLRSKTGVLSLPSRKALWNAITEGMHPSEKNLILTQLDIMSVKQAIHLWPKRLANGISVETILATAMDLAIGIISEKQAFGLRDEFYVDIVENCEHRADELPAMYVGHAATNCIITAADTFTYDPNDLRLDDDYDVEAFEPSFLVSSALANGFPNGGDTALRRSFWNWYLTQATNLT